MLCSDELLRGTGRNWIANVKTGYFYILVNQISNQLTLDDQRRLVELVQEIGAEAQSVTYDASSHGKS